MPTLAQREKRAAQARRNGAKSKGPITPEGLNRARTAPFQHGLYASDETLKATVDETLYEQLRQQYLSDWAPINQYIADKVEDLVAYRWELNRLRQVRRLLLAESCINISASELDAAAKNSPMERLELRVRRCNLEVSRIERDIMRATKHFENHEGSHKPKETNTQPAVIRLWSPPVGNAHQDEAPKASPQPANGTEISPDTGPKQGQMQ